MPGSAGPGRSPGPALSGNFPPILNPVTSLLRLNLETGILSVEIDQIVNTQSGNAGPPPSYLTDKTPVSYYGTRCGTGMLCSLEIN